MAEGDSYYCCWQCFFKYRGKPGNIHCYHRRKKIEIIWNENEEFYETTEVRSPPDNLLDRVWGNVRLCDPHKGTCRRSRCTFAHGTQEQSEWNKHLRNQRRKAGGK